MELVVAFIVALPIILWAIDRKVVKQPCDRCGERISRKAAVCPHCRHEQ